jgi:hypothetical protein
MEQRSPGTHGTTARQELIARFDTVTANAEALVARIVTLSSNPHYRIGDVIYGMSPHHQESAHNVLARPEFEGKVLRRYLEARGMEYKRPDFELLARLVAEVHIEKPAEDEVALHVRAGDVVEHDWFLQRDFAREILRYERASRVRIVTAFAFQEFRERGWFSEEMVSKNRQRLTRLIRDLMWQFPHLDFDVVSNVDIDADLAYLAAAPHFVRDVGGFSDIVEEVRYQRDATHSDPFHRIAALRRVGYHGPRLSAGRKVIAGDSRSDPVFHAGWHPGDGACRTTRNDAAMLLFNVEARPGAALRLVFKSPGDQPIVYRVNGRVVQPVEHGAGQRVVPLEAEDGLVLVALESAVYRAQDQSRLENSPPLAAVLSELEVVSR